MDLFEAIKTRKSVRKFKDDIPSKDDVKKIIDAARLAPSGHNKQNWYFIVIYNKDVQKQLKNAVSAKYDELKTFPEAEGEEKKIDHSKSYAIFFDRAPVLIAVLNERSINTCEKVLRDRGAAEEEVSRFRPRPDIQSIGAAIQNICLAAVKLSYGTCWMTAPILAYKEMENILNISSKYHLVALVCLGKPDNGYSEVAEDNKKPLEEILTFMD